jgi:aminopeptidase N
MMNLFLGEEVFRVGISNYLKAHRFSNAVQDNLWDSLTSEAHRVGVLPPDMSVNKIMDTWTLQTGYPIITVTRDYQRGTATITQVSSVTLSHYYTAFLVKVVAVVTKYHGMKMYPALN